MSAQKQQLIIPTTPQVGLIYNPATNTAANRKANDILTTTREQQEHLPLIDYIVGAGTKYVFDPKTQGYKAIGPVDTCPKQGWYIYHVGKKYPQPGFPNPYSLEATEGPKRHLINWIRSFTSKEMLPVMGVFALMPRKIKGKILEHFLLRYLELADAHLQRHYPKVEYFLPISLEIKGFITLFLINLGVTLSTANRFAYAFATIIDIDTAYRCRIMDLLTETTKEKMLAHPILETLCLVRILSERDDRKHLVDKFNKFALLMKFGYFFIRKPFKVALKSTDFNNFQYDEINRHFVKHWTTYNFFGKTIEERIKIYPLENYPKFQLNQ